MNKVASEILGQPVLNPWVCDTPAEFRKKLEEAFNLSVIKTKILNLVSSYSEAVDIAEKAVDVE